jgi:hypothetical protein
MRSKILNQYRTELGRKVWGQYACGERKYGTRHNLMAFSCRPDFKTSSVMRGGQINYLLEVYEEVYT